MVFPSLEDFNFKGKKALLRTNYDVPLKKVQSSNSKVQSWEIENAERIEESFRTIRYLVKSGAKKVVIISHLGRPEGKCVSELSLKAVAEYIDEKLGREVPDGCEVYLRENLRFDLGEESNDAVFARELAKLGDVFVNDAFACCHRRHASIVGVPGLLPSLFGFDCAEEIRTLDKVRNEAKRPVVAVFGGAKEDKLEAALGLAGWADWVLIGGRLPQLRETGDVRSETQSGRQKIQWAELREDGKDISEKSAKEFAEIIGKAGTVVWAGPMGVYEEAGAETGTKIIGTAVAESGAFKVVGGGDTETALVKFNLAEKIDYISSGGGAMLEFLAKGTLPGIEAITKTNSKLK